MTLLHRAGPAKAKLARASGKIAPGKPVGAVQLALT